MLTHLILSALAATSIAQYTKRSLGFQLMVLSDDDPLADDNPINGTVLAACHEGAGQKGLCVTASDGSAPERWTTYYHNVSESAESQNDEDGILGYDFIVNTDQIYPSAMTLQNYDTSNVAVPIFGVGTQGSIVRFSECGTMYIRAGYDDTVVPTQYSEEKVENWQICQTRWAYTYWTLAWVIGLKNPKPQNPSCSPVRVVRVFV